MSTKVNEHDELAMLFRDTVLVLGGVFATRGTDDETIRRVATGLELVHRRARGEHLDVPRGRPSLEPHPAIEMLLRLVREDLSVASDATPFTPLIDPAEFLRLPGLFCRWDIEQVLDADHRFHIEGAGSTTDGTQLFAVYRQEA